MNKIIEGMKEALEVAKCDHEIECISDPRQIGFRRYFCPKCKARFYENVTYYNQQVKQEGK